MVLHQQVTDFLNKKGVLIVGNHNLEVQAVDGRKFSLSDLLVEFTEEFVERNKCTIAASAYRDNY